MAIVISWHGAKLRKNQGQGNVFICSRALRTERNGAERGKNEWHSFIDLDFYDWNRVCVSKNDIEIQRGHLRRVLELSSVSGNPFPSGHELLVFQLKFRNRLGGTEDWKWTSGGILQMGLRSLNLDFQIKNLSISKNKKLFVSQKYSVLLDVLSLEPTIKIIWKL